MTTCNSVSWHRVLTVSNTLEVELFSTLGHEVISGVTFCYWMDLPAHKWAHGLKTTIRDNNELEGELIKMFLKCYMCRVWMRHNSYYLYEEASFSRFTLLCSEACYKGHHVTFHILLTVSRCIFKSTAAQPYTNMHWLRVKLDTYLSVEAENSYL